MSSPVDGVASTTSRDPAQERPQNVHIHSHERSDEEGTVVDDATNSFAGDPPSNMTRQTHSYDHTHLAPGDYMDDGLNRTASRSRARNENNRLGDDLAMLKIERQVSEECDLKELRSNNDNNMGRVRSRRDDNLDEFDIATNPVHEKTQTFTRPAQPTTRFAKLAKRIHQSSWLVRYITYISPVVIILLIPLLLGALIFKNSTVGGVQLVWFMIWLMICWLTLWAGRLIAKCTPWPVGVIMGLFTDSPKRWRDMARQLEIPITLFLWGLAVEVSFLPIMTNHEINGNHGTQHWMTVMNKVLVSFFVGFILNLVEKVIIQLIAISFHLRTYQDRIELNKFQIGSLTKLYEFSKKQISMEDYEFEDNSGVASGARTPGQWVNEATKQTKQAVNKFGDVAGKIAGDFTGRDVKKSTHPQQVVLALLNSTSGSQVLARRLYRTFAREETSTVHKEDLSGAFVNDEESDAAFSMFDKDMNGDISMEELEAVCVEIGRERKSISASLKDLDSVVGKLDNVFMFAVIVVVILVFISLISTSAATAITSAGSTLLALSWLFATTAQEFLQSVIFVFVKHPFDVGDRVSVYGNTGTLGRGDDYFVKEISLLYTEFKKMEGHVVQAPNSYLNTLFILNQRRSGGLAEAVPVVLKYGTTLDQIEKLRDRLLEFVESEKREYQSNILTELRDVTEVHSISVNVIFFYKSNWQNEGLRLARRNKFICALMVTMQELGIEGPRMRYPGMKESFPVYLQNIPHLATPGAGHGGHPDKPQGWQPEEHSSREADFVPPPDYAGSLNSTDFQRATSFRTPSRRQRSESLAAMNKRVDFSLGAQAGVAADLAGDVFDDTSRRRGIPPEIREVSASRERDSEDHSRVRASFDTGRSTSMDRFGGGIMRRGTERSVASHRNRFFGRHRTETGMREEYLMESGLARVPEAASGPGSGAASAQVQVPQPARIDPRSGTVSAAAVAEGEKEMMKREEP